jgi:hypothetical protein
METGSTMTSERCMLPNPLCIIMDLPVRAAEPCLLLAAGRSGRPACSRGGGAASWLAGGWSSEAITHPACCERTIAALDMRRRCVARVAPSNG